MICCTWMRSSDSAGRPGASSARMRTSCSRASLSEKLTISLTRSLTSTGSRRVSLVLHQAAQAADDLPGAQRLRRDLLERHLDVVRHAGSAATRRVAALA
jgi:hypothetical protein